MAAPNCAVIFGLVIFLFLPCCIYCEVDQTYIGCYFDTEGNIQIHSSRIKKKPSVFGQAYRNRLTPIVGRVAQWKKKFNQCTAWFWFWDVKETQNFYSVYAKKSVAIMEIAPGDLTHIVNLAIFERNFWLCTTSPPLWLKISFHFWQFWVPFISQNHNQAGEIVELFFPLS